MHGGLSCGAGSAWRRGRAAVCVLIAVGAVALLAPAVSLAGQVDLAWSPTATATSATQTVTLAAAAGASRLPGKTFWSFGGRFAHTADSSDGFYMGLQTGGRNFAGKQVRQQAIFSIWNALSDNPAPAATCGRFSGDGAGLSCHVPMRIVAGHSYRYILSRVAPHTYSAAISDVTTRKRVTIGQITAPGADTLIDNTYDFIDNFSGRPCARQTPGAAWFAKPTLSGGRNAITDVTASNRAACSVGFLKWQAGGVLSGAGASVNTTHTPGKPRLTTTGTGGKQRPSPTPLPPPSPIQPAPGFVPPPSQGGLNPAPPPALPPAGSSTPAAVGGRTIIHTRNAAVVGGVTQIRLHCSGFGVPCAGTIELTSRVVGGYHGGDVKVTVFGTAQYSLRGGGQLYFSVTLNQAARSLLATGQPLRAQTWCLGTNSVQASRALTLGRVPGPPDGTGPPL